MKDETAGGGGGDGAGLSGSVADAHIQAISGGIMARQRLDAASAEPRRCKEVLVDCQDRDKIIGKARGGCGPEAVWEIAVQWSRG